MSEMCGWLCRAARPAAPACMSCQCGVEGSRPHSTPNTQASALKETESGEARAGRSSNHKTTPLREKPLRETTWPLPDGGTRPHHWRRVGFRRRSRAQRRSPLEVRGRLPELRRRARPRLPSASLPASTIARISLAPKSSGAALTTLADSALSPSSLHHSGLATSAHASCVSMLKASAVARAHTPSPPASAPWPRGTAARPPRSAPSCRALHRG